MNFKKWPYWVRGGVMLFAIGFLVAFTKFIALQLIGPLPLPFWMNLIFAELSLPAALLFPFVPSVITHGFVASQEIIIVLLNSVSYFFIGTIGGLIYGKIK